MHKLVKRTKHALIATLVIAVIITALELHAEGWSGTLSALSDMWWIFALLPVVIVALGLFSDLKQGAANAGQKNASQALESLASRKDRKAGTSQLKYAERLQHAEFTKTDAQRIISSKPREFDEIVSQFDKSGKLSALLIPTYLYENGLQGEHLFREVVGDVYTVACIDAGFLVFLGCAAETYKNSQGVTGEIGRIPVSSVREIEVVDNDDNRRMARLAGKATDKVLGNAVRVVTTAKIDPTIIRGATLIVKYITEDGILWSAKFKIPSGVRDTNLTKSAVERVLSFRKDIATLDGVGNLLSGASFIEESPLLEFGNSSLSDLDLAIQIGKVLSAGDSAVPAAKATAEMLATFTQNDGFALTFRSESKQLQLNTPRPE